jgi:hypothetical protein
MTLEGNPGSRERLQCGSVRLNFEGMARRIQEGLERSTRLYKKRPCWGANSLTTGRMASCIPCAGARDRIVLET